MANKIKNMLLENDFILMEGAVVEILRRSEKVTFHPELIHAHLIYDSHGALEMTRIFNAYIELAKQYNQPFIMCSPTWRANSENVQNSGVNKALNRDAILYMDTLRKAAGAYSNNIAIGGVIGPKNDCYTPELALSSKAAEKFHSWQIHELTAAGADFIIAETLPSVEEALGIAQAASKQTIDYIISFVISREGKILDGHSLQNAIELIDQSVSKKPIGYAINCAHPSFLKPEQQPKEIFERLIAFLGNASSLDHCELDNASSLHVDNISEWGDEMLNLHKNYGVKILGGCCGTGVKHLENILQKNTYSK